MPLHISIQMMSLLIKEYVQFVLEIPCYLFEVTKRARAKNLDTARASNDLSISCIVLNNMLSFMASLFMT